MKLTADEMQALARMDMEQRMLFSKIVNLLKETQDSLYLEHLRNQSLLTPEHTSQDDRLDLERYIDITTFLAVAPRNDQLPETDMRVIDFLDEDRGYMGKGEALQLREIQQARFRAHGQRDLELAVIQVGEVHDTIGGGIGDVAIPLVKIIDIKEVTHGRI